MNDLIAEEKAEVRRSRVKLVTSLSFAVGGATVGMFAAPHTSIALATAFLSVGGWAIDHVPEVLGAGTEPGPAAMCLSAERHFGWGGHRP